jgi:hypothetical protein
MAKPLLSIIITNYNYARWLRESVNSALGQTYSPCEVIVVDDGSTDHSRDVLEEFAGRITPVYKSNGGQASAFNSGFARCNGDVIMFLDADDELHPTAGERAIARLHETGAAKVHWPLRVIDSIGEDTGAMLPSAPLPQGDLGADLLEEGPWMGANPPTSGNAWSRDFLKQVLPMPEQTYRICADAYLLALAPLYGTLATIDQPLGCYRAHESNNYFGKDFEETIENGCRVVEQQWLAAEAVLAVRGHRPNLSRWAEKSFWHQLRDARGQIAELGKAGESFILIDDEKWGFPEEFLGRRRLWLAEYESENHGPPEDDQHAIRELTAKIQHGATLLIIGSPSFWYLEEYPQFSEYLRSRFRCVRENERLMAFDLKAPFNRQRGTAA